jgi:hypothetical protein
MQENTAIDFYNRITEGTEYEKKITITHKSGQELEEVKMSPVTKQVLADVIQKLPEDMFEAVEEADDPDEAEEMLEEKGESMSLSAMSEDTVDAFERLVKESLSHDDLTDTQMKKIVDSLNFELLFELGGDIIDMSFAQSGAIKDFREQE